MINLQLVRSRFLELNCCVIIPTYNNDQTLKKVVEDVLIYCPNVIVVNDGSTDTTMGILNQIDNITTVHLSRNQGKGIALQQGFQKATELKYHYAITIDSDGQHFPEDLPLFLNAIALHPESMILGARNMVQKEVPGTSSFGHKFSIFWFRIETGIAVEDVQTGYRLYPLHQLTQIKHVFSTKYEYEVEILVRLAWLGVNVICIPVQVYYAPKETRVSHFRKVRDFTRVSIANTILVFIALLWVKPLKFFKNLRKTSVRQFFRDYIVNNEDSNSKLAKSVALGLFMGVTPIWGWQIVTTIGLAHLLRLNKVVAVTASNISLPPLLPIILFLSYFMGGLVLGSNISGLNYDQGIGFQWIKENISQYLIGSLIFGALLSSVLGFFAYILLSIFRKKQS